MLTLLKLSRYRLRNCFLRNVRSDPSASSRSQKHSGSPFPKATNTVCDFFWIYSIQVTPFGFSFILAKKVKWRGLCQTNMKSAGRPPWCVCVCMNQTMRRLEGIWAARCHGATSTCGCITVLGVVFVEHLLPRASERRSRSQNSGRINSW